MFTEFEHLDQIVVALSRYDSPKAVSIEVDQKKFDTLYSEFSDQLGSVESAVLDFKPQDIRKCNMLIKYKGVMFQIYNKDCIIDK